MAITIPLHAIETFNAQDVPDEPMLLIDITDSSLSGAHIRLCTFPVTRLTDVPATYGCVLANGDTYEYAVSGGVPSDQQDTPITGTLVIDNVTQEFSSTFLKLTAKNNLTLTLVLASDPDTPIRSFNLLSITQCSMTVDSITISFSRDLVIYGGNSSLEPWPSGRQTVQQAPGLHK